MGLEALKEEIIKNAKEQEVALISEARREANRIQKEAEKKIEELKEKNEAETKRMIDVIKKQEIASVELENKKIILDAKKQIIDRVFDEAKNRLENLEDKKREIYIKKLFEKTENEIEIGYIYCNKNDAKFLKGLNVETVNIIGGLVAENKERNVRVDYSFETILQDIKEKELQNINKMLF